MQLLGTPAAAAATADAVALERCCSCLVLSWLSPNFVDYSTGLLADVTAVTAAVPNYSAQLASLVAAGPTDLMPFVTNSSSSYYIHSDKVVPARPKNKQKKEEEEKEQSLNT